MILTLALTAPTPEAPETKRFYSISRSTVNSGERRQRAKFDPAKPTRAKWALPVLRGAAAIPSPYLSFARCVLERESGGTLSRIQSGVGARNPASSASGRWQFLDRSWRSGLSHMVAERLRDHGLSKADSKKVQGWLAAHPIYQWHGYYQNAGFVSVVTEGGWRHWYQSGSPCNGLAPG